MMVLWLEKLNQIDSFCKIGILYAWEGPRSIERGKKHWTPPIRSVFPRPLNHFLSLTWYVAATYQEKLSLAWNVAATYQEKLIFAWNVATYREKLILAWNVAATYQEKLICPDCHVAATFQSKLSLSWYNAATFWEFRARELKGLKQTGFLVVLLSFLSNILLLDSPYVHDMDILKRNRTWLAFCGSMSHWNKSPPLHRGCHHQLNK